MSGFGVVAEQVSILFLLMGIGFVARKTKLLTESTSGGLVNLLLIVVNPCLIVHAFNRPYDSSMLRGLLLALVLGILTHLVLMVIASFVFRRGEESAQVVLKTAAVFSNAGFMGIPLEQALLGPEGVFYGVAYVVVFNLFMWSWGLGLNIDGRLKLTRRMVINPGMGAIVCGLVLFLLPFNLPRLCTETLGHVAAMNTPLAMILIGFYLAGAKFRAVFRLPAAYLAMFIRLVFAPSLVLALLWFCRAHLDRTMMLAILIPAAAPVAAMVSMFAAKHNRDVDLSVALVSVTTLLSIFTMPLLVAVGMSVL